MLQRAAYRSDPARSAKGLAAALLALGLALVELTVLAPAVSAQDAPLAEAGAADAAPTDAAPTPAASTDAVPTAAASSDAAPVAEAPAAQAGAGGKSQAELVQEAVVAFQARLAEVLAYEADVREYERNSLGRVPIGQLKGARLDRRRRIMTDDQGLAQRLSELPDRPLLAPRATQARRKLSAQETAVLRRVGVAYDLSRDTSVLEALQQKNTTFLATENWVERDKAVLARDALIEREVAYAGLISQSREIIARGLSAEQLDAMTAELDRLSPETRPEQGSEIEQLLDDPARQLKVQGELLVLLNRKLDLGLPPQTDAELLAALPGLQQTLMEASGLVEPYAELNGVNAELTKLEASLADRGVNALSLDARRAAVARKAELTLRQNQLDFQVGYTEPALEPARALITTQDALIRRRLFDIGPRAALFAARHDSLKPQSFAKLTTPDKWAFLQDQVALITALDKARPAPTPLEGVTWHPPLVGPVLKADLLKKLPKPGKPKPKGGGR